MERGEGMCRSPDTLVEGVVGSKGTEGFHYVVFGGSAAWSSDLRGGCCCGVVRAAAEFGWGKGSSLPQFFVCILSCSD